MIKEKEYFMYFTPYQIVWAFFGYTICMSSFLGNTQRFFLWGITCGIVAIHSGVHMWLIEQYEKKRDELPC